MEIIHLISLAMASSIPTACDLRKKLQKEQDTLDDALAEHLLGDISKKFEDLAPNDTFLRSTVRHPGEGVSERVISRIIKILEEKGYRVEIMGTYEDGFNIQIMWDI